MKLWLHNEKIRSIATFDKLVVLLIAKLLPNIPSILIISIFSYANWELNFKEMVL